MGSLIEKFASQIPGLRDEIKDLVKEHGNVVLTEATVAMAYGGMRGIKGLICDTSEVNPEKGLIVRGIPLLEITDKIPEEIFYLLVTGDIPTEADVKDLQSEFFL